MNVYVNEFNNPFLKKTEPPFGDMEAPANLMK